MRLVAPVFLVIDFEHDSRFLLVKTLRKHFPGAVIQECDTAEPALAYLRNRSVSAVITHRSLDTPGLELVRHLHETEANVPIVMVSGVECAEGACAAGASAFLPYDEWPRIGELLQALLEAPMPGAAADSEQRRAS